MKIKISEFIYWIEKIHPKSVLFAIAGAILFGTSSMIDSFWISMPFIFLGWYLILWAIAREIKIREPKIGELK